MGFKATRILLLTPPSPPSVVSKALQMSSVKIGEGTRKPKQTMGSPPAIVSDKGKLEEEKEEIKDEEQATIQTLIELPKIGTPT